MELTPGMITAMATGVVIVLGGYGKFIYSLATKKTTKKIINDNGYERRGNSITREEHNLCRDIRENTEKRLFDNQDKIERNIGINRTENRDDFKTLFKKIDELKK